MLVNANSPQTSAGEQQQQRFTRGDKASVSVRLRNRSKNKNGGNGGVSPDKRLSSRHSGDFSFFSAAKMELAPAPPDAHDDWAYISYPNGAPTTTVNSSSAENGALPKQTPVKVVTRKVPGISLSGLKLQGEPDVAASAVQQQQQQNRFSKLHQDSLAANRMHYRRRSEQALSSVAATAAPAPAPIAVSNATATASKRCSGEFQFVRTSKSGLVNDDGNSSQVSASPAPASRTPIRGGLGRRAATQLHIEQRKKNSYNAAMYKSQDNLVKVGNPNAQPL